MYMLYGCACGTVSVVCSTITISIYRKIINCILNFICNYILLGYLIRFGLDISLLKAKKKADDYYIDERLRY